MKYIKTFSIAILMLIISAPSFSQIHLSGHVYDAQTKESLIGANVIDRNTASGTSSNEYGYFNLRVRQGVTTVKCSFIGYVSFEKEVIIQKDTVLNIYLEPGYQLNELTVTGSNSHVRSETGLVTMSSALMEMLPSLAGEVDVIKSLQTMPGISPASEGSASLLVRGGNPDGNLILLDDVPMYYTGHLGGFTSIFDESAIKSLKVYKAGFPARYGGRLSSVVDIRTRDGNMKEHRWEAQIGTLVSKFAYNGPLIQDKTSFSVSYRQSNLNWFLKPFTYFSLFDKEGRLSYKFYDLNVKVNHIVSDKDRIYVGFYRGKDVYDSKMNFSDDESFDYRYQYKLEDGIGWGSKVGSIRWNHVFKPTLFVNLTMAGMIYNYHQYGELNQVEYVSKEMAQYQKSEFFSKVRDYLLKADFNWDAGTKSLVRFGAATTFHQYQPFSSMSEYKIDSTVFLNEYYSKVGYPAAYQHTNGMKKIAATELASYGEYQLQLEKFSLNAGVHGVVYLLDHEYFTSLQPRFSAVYQFIKQASVKTSYARMEQFTHMLSSDNAGGMPSDIWVPVGGIVLPSKSDQLSLGLFFEQEAIGLKWNIDAFYKSLNQLIDFQKGGNIFTVGDEWQDVTETGGKGRVAGFEIYAEKTSDKLTTWVGYTWTKNDRLFENLNEGNPFPAKYERRHDFEITTNYRFNKKVDISATWNYASGIFQTLGAARGKGMDLFSNNSYSMELDSYYEDSGYDVYNVYVYGRKNNYQYPPYHRLDLSVRFRKQKKHGVRSLSLGVINAYNRQNPYTVYYYYGDRKTGVPTLKQKSMFPILPSVSWKYVWGEKL